MYSVWWKTFNNWQEAYRSKFFKEANDWAINHINYSAGTTQRVEIRDSETEEVIDIVYNAEG